MNQHSKMLGSEKIGKLLLKLSTPAIIGMLVQALYNLVDTIFVGQYIGDMAIAGLTIVFPIQMLVMAVAQTIGIGGASIISRGLGGGNVDRAEKAMGNMMTLTVIVSFSIALVGSVFIEPILKVFGASEAVMPYSIEYMRIIILGTVFFVFALSTNNIIRAEGNAKVAMVTMLISAGLNIILDALFIVVFDWGIRGAALATVVAQAITVIYLMCYLFKGKNTVKLKVKNLILKKEIVKEIIAVGSSSFAKQASGSISAIILNNSLGFYGGDAAIAIYGVITRLLNFTLMPMIGIVHGFQPIVGYNYGAKQFNRVKSTIKLSILITSILSTTAFIMLMVFPRFFFSLFHNDPIFIYEGTKAMRIIILALPLIGFQIVGASTFQAIGKAKPSLILNLSRQVLFLIPLALILPRYFGITGLWMAFPLADLSASLITFMMVSRELKALNKESLLYNQV